MAYLTPIRGPKPIERGEQMNPIQVRQTTQTNQMQRNVMCRHYNKCLDRAVDMDWKGFACSDCRDYELEAGEDPAHWQEQEWRAAYLLLRIATGDPRYGSRVEPRYYRPKYRTSLVNGKGMSESEFHKRAEEYIGPCNGYEKFSFPVKQSFPRGHFCPVPSLQQESV